MTGFPEIVRNLPEADAPFRDIRVWLLQGPTASAIFVEAMADSEVPAHSHGAQWGVVVAGELVLTIGGRTRTYGPGQEYLIPAGFVHSATLKKGVRVIDFFDDPNRYRPKKA
jgi:quercetin dioxygenase-like cupin family protein